MFAPARRRCAQRIGAASFQAPQPTTNAPLPAFKTSAASRSFATTSPCQSKIGSQPLSIPPGVTFKVISPSARGRGSRVQAMSTVQIEGPLGKLSMAINPYIQINQDPSLAGPTISVRDSRDAKQRAMWGTTRAYLQNHILGVSEGHSAILSFIGVGYRASVETTATTVEPEYPGQKYINLKVGYSHPIEIGLPKGVNASTPQPTRLLLEGPEKEVVMQLAAKVRMWRKPEPYKGKGIFVNGETIRLKNKRSK